MQPSKVTTEQFDAILEEIVGKMSAGALLAIPGVYEVLSEELNNEVLQRLEETDDDEEECEECGATGEHSERECAANAADNHIEDEACAQRNRPNPPG